MGLDTWLEQDIREFLDDETKTAEVPQPARFEDSASIESNHDWEREITANVQRGDVDSAKRLFTQLRQRFQQTPTTHTEERAQLYELLKESYVTIANLVLDRYRTGQLLQHMEASPGDIFDARIKPVDLGAAEQPRQPGVPEFLPFTKDALAKTPVFAQLEQLGAPSRDDPLSFDPQALMRANIEISSRVEKAQEAASAMDQTVKDLTTALRLALTDTRGAIAALDTMIQKPLQPDVRAAAMELRQAIVDREEMLAFTKQCAIEVTRLAQLAQVRDDLALPTAQRLRQQIDSFTLAHPHYPQRHREQFLRRIDALTAPLARPAPAPGATLSLPTDTFAGPSSAALTR